jgi:hypothetical protein
MASKVKYSDIQMYLEAIANNPNDKRQVDKSNHGRFWKKTYAQFKNDAVPGEDCNGAPIPIVNSDPKKCALYQALVSDAGICDKKQMPRGGPFITDDGYTVKLSNGTVMKGSDINANIVWWLTNGMPEN